MEPSIAGKSSLSPPKTLSDQSSDDLALEQNGDRDIDDRFEKMPKANSIQEKNRIKEKKDDAITQAVNLIQRLQKKERTLIESIQSEASAEINEINKGNGHVTIALNYQGKDLVDMLENIEASANEQTSANQKQAPITNHNFLLKCFQLLFGNESQSIADWLKIKTDNSPYGEKLYNLHDLHCDWLSMGKKLYYNPLSAHRAKLDGFLAQKANFLEQIDQLKKSNEFKLREQLSTNKQVQESNKKIAKLAKNSIKNQVEINRETNVYRNNAMAEEKLKEDIEKNTIFIQELEAQLLDTETQIQIEHEAMEPFKRPIDLHEKKLALLEVLLGLGMNQDTGDPVRVQLIQTAIINILEDSKKKIAQMQKNSEAIFKIRTELQDALLQYENNKSHWSKFWLRRNIVKLAQNARSY
jgi:hypothetical protein